MSTRTSQLIEQTLRQWDDYAAIEDEERLECIVASVRRQRTRGTQTTYVMEPEDIDCETRLHHH